MSVNFESGQDVLCLESWERRQEKIQLEKKVKNEFFSSYPSFVFYIFQLINSFAKIFT